MVHRSFDSKVVTSSTSPTLPSSIYFNSSMDPQCLSSSIRHPLALTSVEQQHEFGFPIYNIRMTNSSNYLAPLANKLKTTQQFLEIHQQQSLQKCISTPVPKKLHWIWLGGILPEKYVHYIYWFALKNPDWDIFFWGDNESELLQNKLQSIHANYYFRNVKQYLQEQRFINTDLILKEENIAGKSDYLRLEVLYQEGGIYQDTDARVIRSFDSAGNLFRWPFVAWESKGWKNLANGVLGMETKSKFLEFAIYLTRENCLTFQHCGILNGAGPAFLTAAIQLWDSSEIVLVEQSYVVTKEGRNMITYHNMDATWKNKDDTPAYAQVRCGQNRRAVSCGECGQEPGVCGGECSWNLRSNLCELAISFG